MLQILLIEDNEDDVFLIKEYFSKNNESLSWQITHVNEISEAISVLSKGGIDLILLDLFLADSRGIESFYQLQSRFSRIPMVVMTSLDDESVAVEAVRHGAQDYLVKGQINPTLLSRVVRYAIERQKIRSDLAEANVRLEQLALVDPLTGLLNRRGLQQVLSFEIPRSSVEDAESLALLIDMDNFKQINDTLGHAVGDVILKEISRKFKASLRANDYAARIGGDEFMILLPKTRLAEGLRVAEKVRLAVSASPIYLASGASVSTTASIGLVTITQRTPTIDQLLMETHNALYKSKRAGKNRVSYEDTTRLKNNGEPQKGEIDNLIAKFQEGGVFYGVKQPILSLTDRRIIGYEICARSKLQSYEMPEDFFRVSFENKILTTVDFQCLRTCLAAASTLNPEYHRHLNLFPSTMLAIPAQHLLDEFAKTNSIDKLCIEISEQQLIGDPSYLVETVQVVRQAGIQVAIDDVGFGRSCLESLILLEPEVVKIDKRCVTGLAHSNALRRSMKRLLKVTQSLHTKVVAEGIESIEDLDVLKDLGVQYGQGFYLAMPN